MDAKELVDLVVKEDELTSSESHEKKNDEVVKCKTPENSNFLKNGKTVILIKIRNFSRLWMTKRTSPLESSHEI